MPYPLGHRADTIELPSFRALLSLACFVEQFGIKLLLFLYQFDQPLVLSVGVCE